MSTVAAEALQVLADRQKGEQLVARATAMADAAVAFWNLDRTAVCASVCDCAQKYMGAEVEQIPCCAPIDDTLSGRHDFPGKSN